MRVMYSFSSCNYPDLVFTQIDGVYPVLITLPLTRINCVYPAQSTIEPESPTITRFQALDGRTRINNDYPVLSTRQSRKPMAFRPCTDGSSAHRYTSLHVAGSGSHAAPMTPTARRCSRIRGHSSRDRLQQEAARKCLEEQQTKLTKHVYAFGRLKVRPCRAKMGLSSICIWLLSTGGLP